MKKFLRKAIFPIMAIVEIIQFYNPFMSEFNYTVFSYLFYFILTLVLILFTVFVIYCNFIKISISDRAKLKDNPELWKKLTDMVDHLEVQIKAIKPQNKLDSFFSLLILVSLLVSSYILISIGHYYLGIFFTIFSLEWMYLTEYNIQKNIVEKTRIKISECQKDSGQLSSTKG